MSSDIEKQNVPAVRPDEVSPLLLEKDRKRSLFLLSVQSDIGRGIVYHVRLSKWYIAWCILMTFATLGVVIYLIIDVHIHKHPVAVWALCLDGLVTFAVAAETALDMYFLAWRFWSSGWHVFDFAVSLLSIVCFVLMLLEVVGTLAAFDEFVSAALLCIRYTAQAVRIVRYIHAASDAKKSQAVVEEEEIRFDAEDEMPRDYDDDFVERNVIAE